MSPETHEDSRSFSPATQIMGYILGAAWFAFLALSDSDRATWLRAVYGFASLVFAAGVGASVIGLRRRKQPAEQGQQRA